MADWLRGPLRDAFHERLSSRDELLGMEMDRTALDKMLNQHLSGRTDLSRSLWLLLSLALWNDRHFQPAARLQLI